MYIDNLCCISYGPDQGIVPVNKKTFPSVKICASRSRFHTIDFIRDNYMIITQGFLDLLLFEITNLA